MASSRLDDGLESTIITSGIQHMRTKRSSTRKHNSIYTQIAVVHSGLRDAELSAVSDPTDCSQIFKPRSLPSKYEFLLESILFKVWVFRFSCKYILKIRNFEISAKRRFNLKPAPRENCHREKRPVSKKKFLKPFLNHFTAKNCPDILKINSKCSFWCFVWTVRESEAKHAYWFWVLFMLYIKIQWSIFCLRASDYMVGVFQNQSQLSAREESNCTLCKSFKIFIMSNCQLFLLQNKSPRLDNKSRDFAEKSWRIRY